MKTGEPPSEPSMDEILASIRQIISSDSKDERKAHTKLEDDEEILDLTEALLEEEPKQRLSPSQKEDTTPEPRQGFKESPASSIAASKTTQSLHSLNNLTQKSLESHNSPSHKGIADKTVENLVSELLKPLLKEWIESHLPNIVQEAVNDQVEKIVRQIGVSLQDSVSEKPQSPRKF